MGTWGYGPFDNDTAADWSGDLNDAPAERREQIIRATLVAVLDNVGYLDSDLAVEAIAAAALIASQRPGGAPITTPYGPDFLVNGETLRLSADLDGLAVRALDRILADESEWRSLWEETAHYAQAQAELLAIRTVLAA
ncbi:MAG TPA: DUF4259 domain-containing protein [Micromonosporaceae bacterium]|jgi:hypothetical protein